MNWPKYFTAHCNLKLNHQDDESLMISCIENRTLHLYTDVVTLVVCSYITCSTD